MTNANDHNPPRRINCEAIRTLHLLEQTLRRHIDDLMKVDCEDAEAAEAVVFAIEAAEKALNNTNPKYNTK